MLRPFLSLVHDDPQIAALARDGGRAFVAVSLRAYLVAALADEVYAASAPALVVAGDDRQARDLAHDLEAWLAPPPPPWGLGARGGPCASPRAAGWPTNPIWRRRRTSSACASPPSTRCSRR